MTQDVHEQHSIVDQLLAELKRTYYAGQRPSYAQLKLIAPSLSLEDYKLLVQRFMEFMREQELQLFKDQEQQLTQAYPYIPEHVTEDLLYFEQGVFSQFARFLMQRDQSIAQSVAKDMDLQRKQVMALTSENAMLKRENHKLQVQISALETSLSRLDESYQFECKAHQQALVELNKLRESDGAGLLFVKLLKQHLDSPEFTKLSQSLSNSTAEALIALLKRADLPEDLNPNNNTESTEVKAQAQAEYEALMDSGVGKDKELDADLSDKSLFSSGNNTLDGKRQDNKGQYLANAEQDASAEEMSHADGDKADGALEASYQSLSVESELAKYRHLKFDDLSSLYPKHTKINPETLDLALEQLDANFELPPDFLGEQLGLDSSQDEDEPSEPNEPKAGSIFKRSAELSLDNPNAQSLSAAKQDVLGKPNLLDEVDESLVLEEEELPLDDSLASDDEVYALGVDEAAKDEVVDADITDDADVAQVKDPEQLTDLTNAAQRLPQTTIDTQDHEDSGEEAIKNEEAIKAALAAIISSAPLVDPAARKSPAAQVLHSLQDSMHKVHAAKQPSHATLESTITSESKLDNVQSGSQDQAESKVTTLNIAEKIDALEQIRERLFVEQDADQECEDVTPMEIEALVHEALAQNIFTPEQELMCRKLAVKLMFAGRDAVSEQDANAQIQDLLQGIKDPEQRFLAQAAMAWHLPQAMDFTATTHLDDKGEYEPIQGTSSQESQLNKLKPNEDSVQQTIALEDESASLIVAPVSQVDNEKTTSCGDLAAVTAKTESKPANNTITASPVLDQASDADQTLLLDQDSVLDQNSDSLISDPNSESNAATSKVADTFFNTLDSTCDGTIDNSEEDSADTVQDANIIEFSLAANEEQDEEIRTSRKRVEFSMQEPLDKSESLEDGLPAEESELSEESGVSKTTEVIQQTETKSDKSDNKVQPHGEHIVSAEQGSSDVAVQASIEDDTNQSSVQGPSKGASVDNDAATATSQAITDSAREEQVGLSIAQTPLDLASLALSRDSRFVGSKGRSAASTPTPVIPKSQSVEQEDKEQGTEQNTEKRSDIEQPSYQDGQQVELASTPSFNQDIVQASVHTPVESEHPNLDQATAESEYPTSEQAITESEHQTPDQVTVQPALSQTTGIAQAISWLSAAGLMGKNDTLSVAPVPFEVLTPSASYTVPQKALVDVAIQNANTEQSTNNQAQGVESHNLAQSEKTDAVDNLAYTDETPVATGSEHDVTSEITTDSKHTEDSKSRVNSESAPDLNALDSQVPASAAQVTASQLAHQTQSVDITQSTHPIQGEQSTPTTQIDLVSLENRAAQIDLVSLENKAVQAAANLDPNKASAAISKEPTLNSSAKSTLQETEALSEAEVFSGSQSMPNGELDKSVEQPVTGYTGEKHLDAANQNTVDHDAQNKNVADKATANENAAEQDLAIQATSEQKVADDIAVKSNALTNALVEQEAVKAGVDQQKAVTHVQEHGSSISGDAAISASIESTLAQGTENLPKTNERENKERSIYNVLHDLAAHQPMEVLNDAPRSLVRDESTLVKETSAPSGDDSIAAFAAATAKVESLAHFLGESNQEQRQQLQDITFNFNQNGISTSHVSTSNQQKGEQATAELAKVAQDVLKVASELDAKTEQARQARKQTSIFERPYQSPDLNKLALADEGDDFVSGNIRNEDDISFSNNVSGIAESAMAHAPKDTRVYAEERSTQDAGSHGSAILENPDLVSESTAKHTGIEEQNNTTLHQSSLADSSSLELMPQVGHTISSNDSTLITSFPAATNSNLSLNSHAAPDDASQSSSDNLGQSQSVDKNIETKSAESANGVDTVLPSSNLQSPESQRTGTQNNEAPKLSTQSTGTPNNGEQNNVSRNAEAHDTESVLNTEQHSHGSGIHWMTPDSFKSVENKTSDSINAAAFLNTGNSTDGFVHSSNQSSNQESAQVNTTYHADDDSSSATNFKVAFSLQESNCAEQVSDNKQSTLADTFKVAESNTADSNTFDIAEQSLSNAQMEQTSKNSEHETSVLDKSKTSDPEFKSTVYEPKDSGTAFSESENTESEVLKSEQNSVLTLESSSSQEEYKNEFALQEQQPIADVDVVLHDGASLVDEVEADDSTKIIFTAVDNKSQEHSSEHFEVEVEVATPETVQFELGETTSTLQSKVSSEVISSEDKFQQSSASELQTIEQKQSEGASADLSASTPLNAVHSVEPTSENSQQGSDEQVSKQDSSLDKVEVSTKDVDSENSSSLSTQNSQLENGENNNDKDAVTVAGSLSNDTAQDGSASENSVANLHALDKVGVENSALESLVTDHPKFSDAELESLKQASLQLKECYQRKEHELKQLTSRLGAAGSSVASIDPRALYMEALNEVLANHKEMSDRLKQALKEQSEGEFFPAQAVLEQGHIQTTAQTVTPKQILSLSAETLILQSEQSYMSPKPLTATLNAQTVQPSSLAATKNNLPEVTVFQDPSAKSVNNNGTDVRNQSDSEVVSLTETDIRNQSGVDVGTQDVSLTEDMKSLQESNKQALQNKADLETSENSALLVKSDASKHYHDELPDYEKQVISHFHSEDDFKRESHKFEHKLQSQASKDVVDSKDVVEPQEHDGFVVLNEQEEMEPLEPLASGVTFSLDPDSINADSTKLEIKDSGMFSLVSDGVYKAQPKPQNQEEHKSRIVWHSAYDTESTDNDKDKGLNLQHFTFDPKPHTDMLHLGSDSLSNDSLSKDSLSKDNLSTYSLNNSNLNKSSLFSTDKSSLDWGQDKGYKSSFKGSSLFNSDLNTGNPLNFSYGHMDRHDSLHLHLAPSEFSNDKQSHSAEPSHTVDPALGVGADKYGSQGSISRGIFGAPLELEKSEKAWSNHQKGTDPTWGETKGSDLATSKSTAGFNLKPAPTKPARSPIKWQEHPSKED